MYKTLKSDCKSTHNRGNFYGKQISVGKRFFANFNFTVLNEARVTIGDNVTIGAGSVVVSDIPSNTIAVGNPCKVIKRVST